MDNKQHKRERKKNQALRKRNIQQNMIKKKVETLRKNSRQRRDAKEISLLKKGARRKRSRDTCLH